MACSPRDPHPQSSQTTANTDYHTLQQFRDVLKTKFEFSLGFYLLIVSFVGFKAQPFPVLCFSLPSSAKWDPGCLVPAAGPGPWAPEPLSFLEGELGENSAEAAKPSLVRGETKPRAG